MSVEKVKTLVIGAGQAGLAMSEHLCRTGQSHVVLERHRIAERWRSERWDSLVANGPAWHDRFPSQEFDAPPDDFVSAGDIVRYLEAVAARVDAPVRTGVAVEAVVRSGTGFQVATSAGAFEADNVVVATGPFQKPVIPPVIPAKAGLTQIHSAHYRNPAALPAGNVLVIGAGSSGVQIADELQRAGRSVHLAVGPHNRPPRRYRGKDFVWWLGALGKWDATSADPAMEHVTIAVSGARGGHTVDFRALAAIGVILVGRVEGYRDGVVAVAGDLARNVAMGDADYLSVLDEADAYVVRNGLDFPDEPEARAMLADPACLTNPIRSIDLAAAGITSVIWATGYERDFGWLKLDAFDEKGNPRHQRGVSVVPGLYFLGLPFLSRRASPFIWGVWHDAAHLAEAIAARG